MRYAKLLGIALLATVVSVGCGQLPTMDQDISGYGGSKGYGKKRDSGSDITQANVIGSVTVGNTIRQDIDQVQVSSNGAPPYGNSTYLGTPNGGSATATATSGSAQQSQAAAQAASIDGDVNAIVVIKQENTIEANRYPKKKHDRKKHYGGND